MPRESFADVGDLIALEERIGQNFCAALERGFRAKGFDWFSGGQLCPDFDFSCVGRFYQASGGESSGSEIT